MAFNLADYEDVKTRLDRFWADHRDTGLVETWPEWNDPDYSKCVFGARVSWDGQARGTGFAFEMVTASGVNQRSHVENCETSAIGRALANAGYAAKGKPRPSREEMSKVAAAPPTATAAKAASDAQVEKIRTLAAAKGPGAAVAADKAIEGQRVKHGFVPAGWAGAQIGRLS